jgi:integral membrane protein
MIAALRQLRVVSLLEGASYACLMCIGMPLKYVFHQPIVVRVFGSAHGLITLVFLLCLVRALSEGWSIKRAATAFGASLLPFGAFWFDRSLSREIKETSGVT